MQGDPKITLIGAGGMSFGPVMVLDAINNPKLRGALMMLHDINAEKLDVVYNLAQRLNHKRGNPIRIDRLATADGAGRSLLPLHRLGRSGEQASPIIEALHRRERAYLDAVNVPNRGYVPNLPEGAIVEIPAWTGADNLEPEAVPALHQPLADLMNMQVQIQDLVVKAALTRDPAPAFAALRMDPLSPPDEGRCRKMFDELMAAQAGVLPLGGH